MFDFINEHNKYLRCLNIVKWWATIWT